MAIPEALLTVIKNYESSCLAIDDPEVILQAKFVAYYAAMLNAAEEDPLVEFQDEMVEYLTAELKTHVEIYQQLVNTHV